MWVILILSQLSEGGAHWDTFLKLIICHKVVLIEGLDGFPRLSLQMGGSSDHSFDDQQQLGQLEQLEQLQQLQLELEEDLEEEEEDGSEILASFLDQLEEENKRWFSQRKQFSMPIYGN